MFKAYQVNNNKYFCAIFDTTAQHRCVYFETVSHE